MQRNRRIVLLDTMVVAGLFALTKRGKSVKKQSAQWLGAVVSITPKNYVYDIPTPVCYELMCWNKEWHAFVLKSSDMALFRSVTEVIPSEVMHKAALYSVESQFVHFDDKRHKVKSMDPIIAAYSLIYGYLILTENERDFPESHFFVRDSKLVVLPQKNGMQRRMLYLLEPR